MRKRGGFSSSIKWYECGELGHIKAECPKLKGKVIREDKNYCGRSSKNSNPKGANFRRKFAEKVLSAIEQLGLSDVEYESYDDDNHDNNDPKDKKNDNDDFTGMCFMARNNDDNEDESDPDEVRPSYDELEDGLIKLAVELKKTKKKLKENNGLVESLTSEIEKLKISAHTCFRQWL